MGVHIILVSNSSQVISSVMKLVPADCNLDIVSGFAELHEKMTTEAYQGILIDVLTKMKGSFEDKEKVDPFLTIFPVLSLRWNPNEKSISTLGGLTIANFIKEECEGFALRRIRQSKRRAICLNVMLGTGDKFDLKNAAPTVTLNVSNSGLFLYSTEQWQMGDKVWVQFLDLPQVPIIQVQVRRWQEWGREMKFPGIGVSFENMDEKLHQDFCQKFFV